MGKRGVHALEAVLRCAYRRGIAPFDKAQALAYYRRAAAHAANTAAPIAMAATRSESSFFYAALSLSTCARSFQGVIALRNHSPRWRSVHRFGSRTRKAPRGASGGC